MTDTPALPPVDDSPAGEDRPRTDRAAEHEADEEAIDEELANTFPASDPPARNGTT